MRISHVPLPLAALTRDHILPVNILFLARPITSSVSLGPPSLLITHISHVPFPLAALTRDHILPMHHLSMVPCIISAWPGLQLLFRPIIYIPSYIHQSQYMYPLPHFHHKTLVVSFISVKGPPPYHGPSPLLLACIHKKLFQKLTITYIYMFNRIACVCYLILVTRQVLDSAIK